MTHSGSADTEENFDPKTLNDTPAKQDDLPRRYVEFMVYLESSAGNCLGMQRRKKKKGKAQRKAFDDRDADALNKSRLLPNAIARAKLYVARPYRALLFLICCLLSELFPDGPSCVWSGTGLTRCGTPHTRNSDIFHFMAATTTREITFTCPRL